MKSISSLTTAQIPRHTEEKFLILPLKHVKPVGNLPIKAAKKQRFTSVTDYIDSSPPPYSLIKQCAKFLRKILPNSISTALWHKEPWTRWIYILKVKCEVIKETVSARKDQLSLPWDLNPRPLTLMVLMLIHCAISDTRNHELVENTSLRWSVRSLKRHFLQRDQRSLPWDLNPRPLTLMVHMLIPWAITDTSI